MYRIRYLGLSFHSQPTSAAVWKPPWFCAGCQRSLSMDLGLHSYISLDLGLHSYIYLLWLCPWYFGGTISLWLCCPPLHLKFFFMTKRQEPLKAPWQLKINLLPFAGVKMVNHLPRPVAELGWNVLRRTPSSVTTGAHAHGNSSGFVWSRLRGCA